jgi:hypothetical protein
MMRTHRPRGMLGALAAMSLLIAAACGYSPNPESGALQCGSSNTCPEGYSCQSGRCWKDGAGGQSGSAGTTGTAGRGGSGGGGGAVGIEKFVGTWVFDAAASKRVRQCTDGTNETMMPYDDALTISAGTGAPLLIGYYCGWNADVNGTTTVIRPGQSCDDLVMVPGTKFTFHGESLTLTTTNGTTGMLEASLPYEYGPAAGASNGSCTMKFTAPVTKN